MANEYKDLIVWQKSMDLVDEIYMLTKKTSKRRTLWYIKSNA